MKTNRQERILDIIKNNNVETQSDLLELLRSEGFNVTQATVSRDIKEMRLIKVPDGKGSYKYACDNISMSEEASHLYLFQTSVQSVESAHNLVVIKTGAGMAGAVCAALDATRRAGVMGSIAGDDTIFVALRTDAAAGNLVSDLKKLISRKENENG